MADDAATAVLADGRDGMDGALQAVKGMTGTCCYQFETLVVVVAAHFAFRHKTSFRHQARSGKCESLYSSWKWFLWGQCADSFCELFVQGLHRMVKFDEVPGLKSDFTALKIGGNGLAKLIGSTNPLGSDN